MPQYSVTTSFNPLNHRMLVVFVGLLFLLEGLMLFRYHHTASFFLVFEASILLLAAGLLMQQRQLHPAAIWFVAALVHTVIGVLLLLLFIWKVDWNSWHILGDLFFISARLCAVRGIQLLGATCRPVRSAFYWMALLIISTAIWGWILLSGVPVPWQPIFYIFLDIGVLAWAAPRLESALTGSVPSGRLLWILGWHLFWMAAIFQLLLVFATDTDLPARDIYIHEAIYLPGVICMCLGYLAEIQQRELGLWPFILGTGCALLAWSAGLLYYRPMPLPFLLAWLGIGSFTLIMVTSALLMGFLSTRSRIQRHLIDQNAALTKNRQTKSEFIASVSHELRTPLNAIIGFADLLNMDGTEELDEEQRDYIHEIQTAGDRLLKMVNRILALSKLEAGRTPLKLVSVSITNLIQEVVYSFQERCKASNIDFVVETSKDIPWIKADTEQLENMIKELLENAALAVANSTAPLRKITLTVQLPTNSQLIKSPAVEIICEDTGSGMDAKTMAKVCDALDGNARSGFGLPLVRHQLDLHGGVIRLESKPGDGTRVCLRLPVDPESRATVEPAPDALPLPIDRLGLTPVPQWFLPSAIVVLMLALAITHALGGVTYRFIAALLPTVFGFILIRQGGALRWIGIAFWMDAFAHLWTAFSLLAESTLFEWRWIFLHTTFIFFWVGLARLEPRARPRLSLAPFALLTLVMISPLILQLWRIDGLSTYARYILLAWITIAFALPLLESALKGEAPPGRLLWFLGFMSAFFIHVSAGLLHWMQGGVSYGSLSLIIFLFYISTGLGFWAEIRKFDLRFETISLGLGFFIVVWSMGISVFRQHSATYVYWVASGAAFQFLGALAILFHHYSRANSAQQTLEATKSILSISNAAKSDFLSFMSHQFRTLLYPVIGYCELVKIKGGHELSPEALESVDYIESAGKHLLALMDDIVDISVIEAQEQDPELHRVDMSRLIRNSMAIVHERALKQGVTTELKIAPGISECRTDARFVKQILFNYLSNAVKFSPEGGKVRLIASLEPRRNVLAQCSLFGSETASIECSGENLFLHVAVTDAGTGISADDQVRLFQSYSQLENAQGKGGTGLGLALVRQLVEMLGGAVAVESCLGAGSTFHVWLPWLSEPGTDPRSVGFNRLKTELAGGITTS